MTAKERYYWDVTGHLVVRNTLSQEELDAVNAILDFVIDAGSVHQNEDNHGQRILHFCAGPGRAGRTAPICWSCPNPIASRSATCSPIRSSCNI